MVQLVKILKISALACGAATAALLGGCGGGVQLEGPGFERLGLTGNNNRGDAKVPDRAPLLLPPDRASLPDPQNVQQATVAPRENWPNDPDILAKDEASAAIKKQKEYEDKGDWSKKAGIDEFEKLSDPMARKQGGLIDRIFEKSDSREPNPHPPQN